MNSKNSKTFDPLNLLISLTGKIDLVIKEQVLACTIHRKYKKVI